MSYLFLPKILSRICFLLFSILLISCLISFKIFIHAGLFNYFSFVLGSAVIITGICIWKYRSIKDAIQITLTLPFILFLLWSLFVFLQSGTASQYKNYRIAIVFIFVISFTLLRKANTISFYRAVSFIGTLEGIWCILQYFDKIPTENINFDVTGSFVNPNVVAMYLALALPALLYLCFKPCALYLKIIHYLMLLIIGIGLVLLQCRTAFLGGVFASALFLILHFDVLKRFNHRQLLFASLAIGILCIPIGRQLYLHKKDSADGRKLIWNISSQMIVESPLRGYGTGMFEKEYNLKQAKAIQEGKLNQEELKNASFVLMAYNDYLQQAIEGGIPAVILFIAMLTSFLYPFRDNKNTKLEKNYANENSNIYYAAYAGFAAFALMAIFNFIIGAVPVMLLFCCYSGIICNSGNHKKLIKLTIEPNIVKILLLIFAGLTFYFAYTQLKQAKAHRQNKQAQEFLKSANLEEAENLLLPLRESQQNSVSFCIMYGSLLYSQHKYTEALIQFDNAKKFSSSPKLYYMSAKCLFKLKDNKTAISNLYQLTTLSPKTMKYKFDLMQHLAASNQTKLACFIAQQIINMPAINPNKLTEKYKKEANLLLEKYQNNTSN